MAWPRLPPLVLDGGRTAYHNYPLDLPGQRVPDQAPAHAQMQHSPTVSLHHDTGNPRYKIFYLIFYIICRVDKRGTVDHIGP